MLLGWCDKGKVTAGGPAKRWRVLTIPWRRLQSSAPPRPPQNLAAAKSEIVQTTKENVAEAEDTMAKNKKVATAATCCLFCTVGGITGTMPFMLYYRSDA